MNTRLDRPGGLVDQLAGPEAAAAWLDRELGYREPRPLNAREHARLLESRDSAWCSTCARTPAALALRALRQPHPGRAQLRPPPCSRRASGRLGPLGGAF